ncbi:MAG: hypothetical protein JWN06_1050 [Propionibacteriaceae bacterium]|nr:hypothetical protein [Propionibacteriaceae bacterium]
MRPSRGRSPLGWGWIAALVALAAVFVGLRLVHSQPDPPVPSVSTASRVVVVGVAGRYAPTQTDQAVLSAHADDAQLGAVAIRPRYVGDCAAAGWMTIGAGRRTSVSSHCAPQVSDQKVLGWADYLAAAAANSGDAHPGTLASLVSGCVEAVGPGAALSAAGPDGTLARYRTPEQFQSDRFATSCPITLVDAGTATDAVIAAVAQRADTSLIVTGIGPPAGSDNPALQVIYRLGATPPGWLTSASTRRVGVVTLTDLTRTLIAFDQRGPSTDIPVDGAVFQVEPASITLPDYQRHLRSVAALSDAAPNGYLALGVGGAVLFVIMIVGILRRRFTAPRLILIFGTTLGSAMMLTGAVPWQDSAEPASLLAVAIAVWSVALMSASLRLSRWLAVPPEIVAAGLTVAAFTVDAALGGALQPGSMLNSRPIFALRWYGFGNVTFAVYAAAGLTLAGYVAHRFLAQGRRGAAVVAAALIGGGIIICEGWPSMGTDFGGVIALTPPVLWLLLKLSRVRVTGPKLLAVAAGAVAAIAAISLLDWRRGAGQRSHLGDFVQRILDGDAGDVVIRKAVASAQTILSPLGIGSLLIGAVLWVLMFRFVLPVLESEFSTLRTVAQAALATAVLGTLLNDGGVSVWLTLTSVFSVTVASLWIGRAVRDGHLSLALKDGHRPSATSQHR